MNFRFIFNVDNFGHTLQLFTITGDWNGFIEYVRIDGIGRFIETDSMNNWFLCKKNENKKYNK